MGPALETFLTAFLIGLILSLIVGAATRPFWRRIYRYFVRWRESDMRLEQERKAEQEQRKQAERELRTFCHEENEAQRRGEEPVAQERSSADCRQAERQQEPRQEPRLAQEDAPTEAQAEEVHIGRKSNGA